MTMNVKEHLLNRSVNLELYSKSLVVSEEEQTATFLLWNLSGQLVGFQQYRPEKPKMSKELNPRELRYFTYVSKAENNGQQLVAFGLELLNYNDKNLFVVEGVFDAVKLHNLGLNALAVLSCDPKPLKSWLWSMGFNVVPVCEGDKAGKKLKKLSNNGDFFELEDNVDLGDMNPSDVKSLFHEFL